MDEIDEDHFVKDANEALIAGLDIRSIADRSWQKPSVDDNPAYSRRNDDWPVLGSPATRGIIGELGLKATQTSEADPCAVIGTALAWGSACFGRNRFIRVGDTYHHARHNCAIVGDTSRARKGTSLAPVRRVFRAAEDRLRERSTLPFPSGLPLNVSNGLSSGEGLIAEVRDKLGDDDLGGVQDKRLLVVEPELGGVFRQFQRTGNTLSATMRAAWDGDDLRTMTKSNRISSTEPHICVLGHITQQELNVLLSGNDIFNGLANRFQWLAVRRPKIVPFSQPMADGDVDRIAVEIARVVELAHSKNGREAELTMSNSARDLWVTVYPELTKDHSGVLGAVTSRAEAHVLRLAMTYALFDGGERIEDHHLEAGLTFWRFAFDSAAHIFGGAELDPVAQQVLDMLATGPKTQTEFVNGFGRNQPKRRIDQVLEDLQGRGRIVMVTEATGGRPRKVWRALQ